MKGIPGNRAESYRRMLGLAGWGTPDSGEYDGAASPLVSADWRLVRAGSGKHDRGQTVRLRFDVVPDLIMPGICTVKGHPDEPFSYGRSDGGMSGGLAQGVAGAVLASSCCTSSKRYSLPVRDAYTCASWARVVA